MKKFCKILFLVTIFTLAISVCSYATSEDTSTGNGDTSLDTSTGTTTPDGADSTDPDTTPDDSEGTEPGTTPDDSEGTEPGTTPDDGEGTEPGTTPDDGEGTEPGTTPDDDEGTEPGTTPDDGEGTEPGTTPDDDEGTEPGTTPDDESKEPETDPNAVYSTKDEKSNVQLNAPAGIVPDGTTLKVDIISEGSAFDAIKTALGDVKFNVFDITLMSNGSAVQPNNGTVKISIPIPSDYDKANLIAYRFGADGTKEKEYTVTVEGEFAVIETDHFSNYVLAEKTAAPTDAKENLDNEPKTGIVNPITFVMSVLTFACLGLAICIKKMSK